MTQHLITEEVAAEFRTSPETVRYWRHIGKGPRSFKVGRRVLYAREDVEAWEREAREAAGAAELAALGGGDGEPPGGPGRAAPGTQQHPAERRHRQRDGRTQGDRRNTSAEAVAQPRPESLSGAS